MRKEYDVQVRFRCFPLHPETPKEGRLLQELFGTSQEKIAGMLEHLQRTAKELGLPFTTRTKTYNSRSAQELGLWAEDKNRGDAFHLAAFHAYFAKGLNLADHQVVLDLVREVGLSGEEASKVLAGQSYADKVDRDWDEARFKGITAVPTFLMGQYKLVGAQSYEKLCELMQVNGLVRKI